MDHNSLTMSFQLEVSQIESQHLWTPAKCWDILIFPGDWWNCPAHYPGGPVWREEFKDLDEDTAVIQVRWFRCTKIWMMINYDDWLRYPNFKHVWFSTVRCWGMPKCRIARSFQICGLGLGKRAKRAAVLLADRSTLPNCLFKKGEICTNWDA